MRSEVETIHVLYGTVDDVLRVYPFVDAEMQGKLFNLIVGKRFLGEQVRVQVESPEQSDQLRVLSTLASGQLNTMQVRSQSRPDEMHTLTFLGGVPIACSCESYKFSETKALCKHLREAAVRDLGQQFINAESRQEVSVGT